MHEHIGNLHTDTLTKNADELLTGDLLESNQVVLEVEYHNKQVTAHLMTPDGDIQRKRFNKNTKITRVGYYDGI